MERGEGRNRGSARQRKELAAVSLGRTRPGGEGSGQRSLSVFFKVWSQRPAASASPQDVDRNANFCV